MRRTFMLLLPLVACEPPAKTPATDGTAGDTAGTPDCPEAPVVSVSVSVADQSDAGSEGSAAAILLVAGVCPVVLDFATAGAYPALADLAVPSTATLRFADGAALGIAEGATVTIDGAIEAGRVHIFQGDGSVTGSPLVDAVFPEWFGAIVDDGAPDHVAIAAALDFHPTVSLQAGVYDVSETITLPGGARLEGPVSTPPATPTATLRGALVYPDTEGFHVTRVLGASGVSDLAVRDVVLDGDRHAKLEECWGYPEGDNLVRFEQVTGVVFERVVITGFEGNWGMEDQTYVHATAIVDSSDITWTDVSYTDSRVEGPLFQDCDDVTITGLSAENVDSWTPLNAFYVDGFTLTGSTILDDVGIEWSGSTANLTVKNAYVADNSFTGGWGLDLGDEVGGDPWYPENIVVENNTIETVGLNIYCAPYTTDDYVSGLEIRDNVMLLHRGASATQTDEMVRVDASIDVVIADNELTVIDDGGEAFVRAFSFHDKTEALTISGNTVTGVDAGVAFSGDTTHDGETVISANTITCTDEVRLDTWNGGSTGVWLFRFQTGSFETVLVEDNVISCTGGWVSLIDYTSLYTTPAPFVGTLEVRGNTFLPEEGSERSLEIAGATTATVVDNTPAWVNE